MTVIYQASYRNRSRTVNEKARWKDLSCTYLGGLCAPEIEADGSN